MCEERPCLVFISLILVVFQCLPVFFYLIVVPIVIWNLLFYEVVLFLVINGAFTIMCIKIMNAAHCVGWLHQFSIYAVFHLIVFLTYCIVQIINFFIDYWFHNELNVVYWVSTFWELFFFIFLPYSFTRTSAIFKRKNKLINNN